VSERFAAGERDPRDSGLAQPRHDHVTEVDWIHIRPLTHCRNKAVRAVQVAALRDLHDAGRVIAGLLWIGQSRLTDITDKADVPGAILLLVPTVLVAVLVRPGELAMVSSMLSGVRLLVLGSAASALVAAGVIAGGYSGQAERRIWSDAKWAATGIAGALLLSYFLP
jgi:hypothetical protein